MMLSWNRHLRDSPTTAVGPHPHRPREMVDTPQQGVYTLVEVSSILKCVYWG